MKRLTDRRTVLMAAGTVAVAAVAGATTAQSTDIRGTVEFEGGAIIPEGQIAISFEDTAVEDNARGLLDETRVESDGGSTEIEFSFTLPATLKAASTQQIVAHLERPDGWLIARGSAQFDAGSPVLITLNTVMY